MTRIRKYWTKEMSTQKLNEVLMSKNEDEVPLSRLRDSRFSAKETEMKQMKRIKQKREESEEMQGKKKAKLEWRLEDCAKSIGKLIKLTGEGKNMKFHYETFEFHGTQYGLEDMVLLVPENLNQNTYIAIIKDIYVRAKDGLVKLEVQWLYRQEDIETKYVGKWESGNSKEIFFSFHCDEVFAESVKHKCLVYFVPDDKQIPNLTKHPDFIVQKVYDNINKKLRKFSDKCFAVQQKFEIDVLVAKTISRIGDLPDIKNVQMTKIPRRKRSVRKKCVLQAERMSSENRTEVNSSDYKLVWKKLELLSPNNLDRDNKLEVLLEALLLHMCCANKGEQVGDFEFVWPNDVILVAFALEQALYDFLADDMPKFNYKLELLVEKLKNSRVLARRLLNGELKPEQVVKMKGYELVMADFEEPKSVEDAGFTSKSVGHKDSLEY